MNSGYSYSLPQEQIQVNSFVTKVYSWMFVALLITAFVALQIASTPSIIKILYQNPFIIWGVFIFQLILVFTLSRFIDKLSPIMASVIFILYSALTGVTLSVIFLIYSGASIASTFFITAGTFGAMSLYGYFTKKDLTSLGNILFMALIGIIIASIVNIFTKSSGLYWIITILGVIVFVGLTAYDTQKIKEMALSGIGESEEGQKFALVGALALYLDFINLFILLLRFFGRSRD